MSLINCARSPELTTALKAGHLPSAWEPSLRDHVEACRQCNDLLLVTSALQAARAKSMQTAPLASPSLLWWRAQLRRRNHALHRISQPTSIFGKLALLGTITVAVVAVLWQRQQGAEWVRWLFGFQDVANSHHALATQIPIWNLLLGVLSLGAIALLSALALFLAAERN